jgi:hypothetical protein
MPTPAQSAATAQRNQRLAQQAARRLPPAPGYMDNLNDGVRAESGPGARATRTQLENLRALSGRPPSQPVNLIPLYSSKSPRTSTDREGLIRELGDLCVIPGHELLTDMADKYSATEETPRTDNCRELFLHSLLNTGIRDPTTVAGRDLLNEYLLPQGGGTAAWREVMDPKNGTGTDASNVLLLQAQANSVRLTLLHRRACRASRLLH